MGKIKDGVNVGGRPDKLTPEVAALIIEALQKHNYVSTACELAGISETTFYNWLDRAEKYQTRLIAGDDIEEEGGRFIRFLDGIKRARAGSEGELLGRIDKAGSAPTLIEKRTIEHTLKDGTNKTETIERWKPPDWTANAWILERTKWEKYGQHSSLDIQQAGVVFIERLQRARAAQIVEGEFRELEEIAKQPIVEEIPGERLLASPARSSDVGERLKTAPRQRPIFELIARKEKAASHNCTLSEPSQDRAAQAEQESPTETSSSENQAAKSEGGES
jgi:hypothetical protein